MARSVDYVDLMNRKGPAAPMAAGTSVAVAYAAPLTSERKGRSTDQSRSKKKMAKGKRKQTAKQRAASMRNLAKARAKALSKARRGGKRKLSKSESRRAHRRSRSLRHLGRGHAKHAQMQKRKVSRPPAVPSHVRPGGRKPSRRRKGRKGQTAAQRRASMRNLAKARRARKSARSRHKVRPYSYGVRPKRVHVGKHMSWEARGKAKRKRGKRGRKGQTAAQRRASLRNLRKARAARRHGGMETSKPRKRGRRKGHRKQTAAQRRASLRNLRKARASRRRGHRGMETRRRGRRMARSGYEARETTRKRKGKRGQTAAQRRASMRNLRKARAARKRATRRHPVRGYRKAGRRRVRGHLSWERFRDNPLSGLGIFLGGLGGLVWFGLTDFTDRLIATHPLVDRGTKDAAGHELYADVTPSSGDYTGLFNATAITAPMNAWRWLGGLGMIIAPFGMAWVIGPEHPNWKDAFQGAGFGGLMRIGGKAVIDLLAYLTMWTPMGEQLYDGEMRAQILNSSDLTPLASLPYAASPTTPGVAGAGKPCGQCAQCKNGVGACNENGVGWPSMPREADASGGAQPPAPPPPPPNTTTPGGNITNAPIAGVAKPPALPEPFRTHNPFLFGEAREREEAAA